MMALIVKKQNF